MTLMSLITTLIKDILIIGFFLAWILASCWLFMKYLLTKKRRLWILYHIFRKKYNEQTVKWCLDAYKKGYRNEIELKKILLINGEFSEKKIEEMLFIFSEIIQLKEGVSIRQSSGKTELTEIKERDYNKEK